MRKLIFAALLALLITACGGHPEQAPVAVVPEAYSGQAVLDASLTLYRTHCRNAGHGNVCDRPVEIYANPYLDTDTNGRCDASWEGNALLLRILINEDALQWPSHMVDLLVAHEAEHCLRGVPHDESGEPKLMRPDFLSLDESATQTYAEWLQESFKEKPSGDPIKL